LVKGHWQRVSATLIWWRIIVHVALWPSPDRKHVLLTRSQGSRCEGGGARIKNTCHDPGKRGIWQPTSEVNPRAVALLTRSKVSVNRRIKVRLKSSHSQITTIKTSAWYITGRVYTIVLIAKYNSIFSSHWCLPFTDICQWPLPQDSDSTML